MHPESERTAASTTFRPAPSAVSPARCGMEHDARCGAECATWMRRVLPVTLVACLLLTPGTTRAQVTQSAAASVTLIVVKQPPAAPSVTGALRRLPTGETVRLVGPTALDITAPVPFVAGAGSAIGLTRGQCTPGDHPSHLYVRDNTGRLVIVPEAAEAGSVVLPLSPERAVRYRLIVDAGQSPRSVCLRFLLFDATGQVIADREDVLHLPGDDSPRR